MQNDVTESVGVSQYEPELLKRLPALDKRWSHG